MRRGSNPAWLMDGDLFLGIGLGSDSCAEHECGVKGLRTLFGLDESKDGLPRRTVTVVPKGLELVEFQTASNKRLKQKPLSALAILYREPFIYNREAVATLKEGATKCYGEPTLAAAWDEKEFAIVAYTEGDQAKLKLLWEAFQRKDVAFWPNIGVFHGGTGLTFAIPSLVPQVHKTTMYEGDLDQKKLIAKAKAIDIESVLRKADKRWFALIPKWVQSLVTGEARTNYDIQYWLNPYEQGRYSAGYYTVADLKLWVEDKGPVLGGRRGL